MTGPDIGDQMGVTFASLSEVKPRRATETPIHGVAYGPPSVGVPGRDLIHGLAERVGMGARPGTVRQVPHAPRVDTFHHRGDPAPEIHFVGPRRRPDGIQAGGQ